MLTRTFLQTLLLILVVGCASYDGIPMDATELWTDTNTCRPIGSFGSDLESKKKVLVIPYIESVDDPRRCSVKKMTVAVRYQGAFRRVYGEQGNLNVPNEIILPGEAIDPVILHLRAQAEKHYEKTKVLPEEIRPPFKILVFGHGGMVSQEGALRNAEALAPFMLEDGYQPLFLLWNSEFRLAYPDSLCCVRKGQRDTFGDTFSIPARLLSDLGGSLFRSPEVFFDQAIRWNQSVVKRSGTEYYLTEERLQRACDLLGINPADPVAYNECITQRVSLPFILPETLDYFQDETQKQQADKILNDQVYRIRQKEIQYTALYPVRTVTTVLGTDVGTRAWDNMVRRTRLPFERFVPYSAYAQSLDDYNLNVAANGQDCIELTQEANERQQSLEQDLERELRNRDRVTGGFALFFDRLRCELGREGVFEIDGNKVEVELHFYGHSMGALVGNELLSRYDDLPWKKVVYMAGASTIRDFRLLAAPTIRDNEIEFHNLSLHPISESRELFWGGVPPQGSLLEWIDELFEEPRTADQRTIGKWTNIEKVLPALDQELKDRMHFRVFPKQGRLKKDENNRRVTDLEDAAYQKLCYDEEIPGIGFNAAGRCHPVKHGDFTVFSFWRDAYLNGSP